MSTYNNWKVNDTINICASVADFCGTTNFIRVYAVEISLPPDNCSNLPIDTNDGCGIHFNNVEITFSLVKGMDSTNCSVAQTYKTFPGVRTSSIGAAGISYTVTEQDRLNYISATNEGYSFYVMACITNSDGQVVTTNISEISSSITINQNLCYNVTCPDICVGNDLYSQVCEPTTGNCIQGSLKEVNSLICTSGSTHHIDISLKPYSWYTSQGATDSIITKMTDLNGALLNLFSGITDWEYITTEILTDVDKVIIRIHLKDVNPIASSQLSQQLSLHKSNIKTLAVPVIIAEIGAILSTVLLIVIAVGIVYSVTLVTSALVSIFGKDYTTEEVGTFINDVITKQKDECKINFPNDPINYALCVKSVTTGGADGSADFFDDPDLSTAGQDASTAIDTCIAQYNIDNDLAKFDLCIDNATKIVTDAITESTTDCWISLPDGTCFLSAKTGKAIILGTVLIAGVYIIIKRKK